MPSIDERVVSMAFENAVFEQRVAQTMGSLTKLNDAIAKTGQTSGLSNLETEANKVTLQAPMSAIDKLKAKLGFGREAQTAFSEVETASGRVHLSGATSAIDRLKGKFTFGREAQTAFNEVESSANRVQLSGANQAIDRTAGHFSAISSAAQKVDVSGISRGVDSAVHAFSVLEGAAAVALGNIVSKAAMAGASLIKSLSLGPLSQGFEEYSTNLNAIQTTLANTQAAGTTLSDVNSTLSELNTYSDETIYNFGQMAKNIGTFTAAGVGLKDSAQSIKGIANLAALSGSNSQQASTAMYQLSQAIAAGKVNLQDWNSVVNAGMGGKVFQKALFDTGKAMGTITNSPVGQTFKEWEKSGNSFRQSLSATQKAAKDGTSQLKDAQKESAKSVADAHKASSEAIQNAADRLKDAQEASAEAVANAAKKVRDAEESAAESTKNAADKVKEAKRGVAEASKQASADIEAAVTAQREAIKQSATDVANALKGVVEARKRLIEAMKPPSQDELQAATDRLKTAQLDQQDLADAVTEAQREQKRAAEDLAAAQEKLSQLQRSGASDSDIMAATRSVEDAQSRVTDSADAVERALLAQNSATRDVNNATSELTETQKKGTDEDQNVIDAKDALAVATSEYGNTLKKAQQDEIEGERQIRAIRLQAAQDKKQAGKDLAEAEKDQAKTIRNARESVAQAETDQAKIIIESRKSVAEAENAQADAIKDARERVADAEEQAAERIKTARESLSGGEQGPPSWLTSDVLTSTLKQFTGDMTKAELVAQGFTEEQAKAILKVAETAKKSATEVKTLKGVFDVVKESIGSGWSESFKLIFGNFNQAKKTFTALKDYITGWTDSVAEARNKVLKEWAALGGRKDLIEGIKAGWEAILAVLKPIRDAFREIFPAKTGQDLADMTSSFRNFMENLKISEDTAENVRRTFKGFFAALDIGWGIVKGLAGVFLDLFGAAGKSSGGILDFTGNIGDFLVKLDLALNEGGGFKRFFEGLSSVLKGALGFIKDIAEWIGNMFKGGDAEGAKTFGDAVNTLKTRVQPLAGVLNKLSDAWDKQVGLFKDVKTAISPLLENIGEVLSNLGDSVANGIKNLDMEKVLLAVQTTLIGGIFLAIKKGLSGGIDVDVGGGFLKKIGGVLDVVTNKLKAMQQNIQADTLLKIAAALGILTAAIFVLSQIDPKNLAKAMAAMAVGFAEMTAVMVAIDKFTASGSFAKMPASAAAMILMATAMVIMGAAAKIFATMSWEEIAKGLVGVAGSLTAVGIGMQLIGPGILPASLGILAVAVAMTIMAAAMKIFATMSWEEIGKGLVGVLGALGAMGAGLLLVGPSLLLVGPGLIAAAIGMTILANAIKIFGSMDLKQLAKGIIASSIAVEALGMATAFLPPTLALQAAGLILLGVGLTALAGAIAILGNMKVSTLVKGIIAMGAALVVLGAGLIFMSGTFLGTVALLGAAAALAILAPTLAFLGSLNWGTIFKGLAAIALTLGTLAIVGALAAVPLIALGGALAVMGLGLTVIAAAVYLAAKGLSLIGESGAKAVTTLVAALSAMITLLPTMVINFVKGLVEILAAIVKLAPKIAESLAKIITTLLDMVKNLAPKIAETIGALVTSILQVLTDNAPKILLAGWTLLLNLLKGLSDNISKVSETVGTIIANFLQAMTGKLPTILAKGAELLGKFLAGIATKVPEIVAKGGHIILKFLQGLTEQAPKIIGQATKLITNWLGAVAKAVPRIIAQGANIIIKFIDGVGDALPRVIRAGARLIIKFIDGIADTLPRIVDAGFKAIVRFLHGIANAIRENDDALINAGADILDALVDGVVKAAGKLGGPMRHAIEGLFGLLPGWAKKILGIHSPSTVFQEIGRQTMEGMAVGLSDTRSIDRATTVATNNIIDSLSKVPDALEGVIDTEPVITPILDLSNVERDAGKLGTLTDVTPISAAVSAKQAVVIASEKQQVSDTLATGTPSVQTAPAVSFTQNNYSPEALSDVEIYRKTNNQLSNVKRVLGV